MTTVQQDNVTDAAQRLCIDTHELFKLWAMEVNPQDFHNFGEISHSQWLKKGYQAIPDTMKDWLLQICNGEKIYLRSQHRQLRLFTQGA